MTVINLADFKKKKEVLADEQAKAKAPPRDKKFETEAENFRWIKMDPKTIFVKMDIDKLPPAFPPDEPPPMAA